MSLEEKIIKPCKLCNGTGVIDAELCVCSLKFRTYNRMIDAGFNEITIDLINSSDYSLPYFENESYDKIIKYYSTKVSEVIDNGLSLYIYSSERARGKTTLAHYLVYRLVSNYVHTNVYSRSRTYRFVRSNDLIEEFKIGEKKSTYSTVLVIDDLGNEDRSSSWKKEIMLNGLQSMMHYRRDHQLPTIITSNYSPSDISNAYNGMLDSLLEINPDGTISGVLFKQIEVGGAEDLRISLKSKWPDNI